MDRRTEIFEKMPVRRAVILQVIPAVASQLITLIYNLADTYFVGLLNDPAQTAAITVAAPPFLLLSALANLFGVGGASLISRSLGAKEYRKTKYASAISIWLGVFSAAAYSLLFAAFAQPILYLCGATDATFDTVFGYSKWVILFGGTGTVLNMLLAHLVRSEGSAGAASFGVSLGGVLNILLDPLFILPDFLNMGAQGAGIATAVSNYAASAFLLCYLAVKRKTTALSANPVRLRKTGEYIGQIFKIGFPSAVQMILTVVSIAAQSKFVSGYRTEAVAALGITKKLDQLPLFFSIGVSNGLMPMLAYNYASGNVRRRKSAFRFGCTVSVAFAVLSLILYEIFAPQLVSLFMDDPTTVAFGADFVRCMVVAMPMMAFCYPMIIQFQAMGKVKESLVCSLLRKGLLDIPLLFLLDALFPLYGCMWVQPIVDTVSLIVALLLYLSLSRRESAAE